MANSDTDDDNEEKENVNIRIKRDTWQKLHDLKGPNDSHDDVISELIEATEGK